MNAKLRREMPERGAEKLYGIELPPPAKTRAERREKNYSRTTNSAIREIDGTRRTFWKWINDVVWLPCVAAVPHFNPGRYCETKTRSGIAIGGYR